MKTFKSDVSGQTFSEGQRVSAKVLHPSIIKQIRLSVPDFPDDGYLAVDELQHLHARNAEYLLSASRRDETLGDDEMDVVDHLLSRTLVSADVDDDEGTSTFGQRTADAVATFGGSWTFIIIFSVVIVVWMITNVVILRGGAFDPYPFILLNLVLSCLAALQAPVIMMSQNRQEEKDRRRSKADYKVNLMAEVEIRTLHEKIDHMLTLLTQERGAVDEPEQR